MTKTMLEWKLNKLLDAIKENVDEEGNIKLQYIAEELDVLGYFNCRFCGDPTHECETPTLP